MAMAISASVTVSIGEEINGTLSSRPSARVVRTSVSAGITSERAGTKRTSSNVNPGSMDRLEAISNLSRWASVVHEFSTLVRGQFAAPQLQVQPEI